MKKIKAYDVAKSSLESDIIIPAHGGYFVILSCLEYEDNYMFIPGKIIKAINKINESNRKDRK